MLTLAGKRRSRRRPGLSLLILREEKDGVESSFRRFRYTFDFENPFLTKWGHGFTRLMFEIGKNSSYASDVNAGCLVL